MKQILDADLIEGFQHAYLWEKFDSPSPTGEFHRTMWRQASDPKNKYAAWAAPRGHSKSTSISFTYALAALLFRLRDYLVLISDSEGQAVQFLRDIKAELLENDALRADFKLTAKFVKDTETELEVECQDGHVFRIVAKGSEQKFRGLKWRNRRPNLIIGDDLEFDECVMNPDRRRKFKDSFFKQILPCGSDNCLYRIVGTILHFDSLLMGLMNAEGWTTELWSAHEGFDDFSNILWPEHYDEKSLRAKRQVFIDQGMADAYSQEYLNNPLAEGNTFFNEEDIRPIPEYLIRDWEFSTKRQVTFYVSIDLAVSKKQTADNAVITVATLDSDSFLDIVDIRKGRFGPEEFVNEMFRVDEMYEEQGIDTWFVEAGAIQKSILPYLNNEMARRQRFLNLHFIVPSQDKQTRAQSIRARMRAGRVRFDEDADWYAYIRQELLQFPRGKHDDGVDTLSQFGLALDEIIEPPSEDDLDEEQYQLEKREGMASGRSLTTGY